MRNPLRNAYISRIRHGLRVAANADLTLSALPEKHGTSGANTSEMFTRIKRCGFQVVMLHHAEAILKHDMSRAVVELEQILLAVSLPVEELVRGGGGEADMTQRTRHSRHDAGWIKHRFEINKTVD